MQREPQLPNRPFTWAEARARGFTRWRFDRLVETGRIRRVTRAVYQSTDLPDTIENRALAAALASTPHAVFCDRTAAWLHGVDVFDYTELEVLPALDCVVPAGEHRVQRSCCLGGERTLIAEDLCEVYGVKATTPLRTAFDLACVMSRWNALATLDQFMRVCGVTKQQMLALLPRFRGRRGVVQLRSLVPLATAESESPGESWARIVIHDEDLPAPKPQHWVETDDGWIRLDLAYPHHKITVEYDGYDFHLRTEEQREADRKRRKWLPDNGWYVIVLTKSSFNSVALNAWLAELRRELAARRPARLARH
jgi:hypothetical protein